jgi:hypothetical protein
MVQRIAQLVTQVNDLVTRKTEAQRNGKRPAAPIPASRGSALLGGDPRPWPQVFPFTLFAGLVFPFNRGLHHEGATAIFVSQGAGTFMPRVRLGKPLCHHFLAAPSSKALWIDIP